MDNHYNICSINGSFILSTSDDKTILKSILQKSKEIENLRIIYPKLFREKRKKGKTKKDAKRKIEFKSNDTGIFTRRDTTDRRISGTKKRRRDDRINHERNHNPQNHR